MKYRFDDHWSDCHISLLVDNQEPYPQRWKTRVRRLDYWSDSLILSFDPSADDDGLRFFISLSVFILVHVYHYIKKSKFMWLIVNWSFNIKSNISELIPFQNRALTMSAISFHLCQSLTNLVILKSPSFVNTKPNFSNTLSRNENMI